MVCSIEACEHLVVSDSATMRQQLHQGHVTAKGRKDKLRGSESDARLVGHVLWRQKRDLLLAS